jgi:hypothetical protein
MEGSYQPISENDKSLERDDVFSTWLDSLPQPSIG